MHCTAILKTILIIVFIFVQRMVELNGIISCNDYSIYYSHGEVIAMRVLNMVHLKSHPLQDVCIIALATLSKVFFVYS